MPIANGLSQTGYHDLDGKAGFKLAMQEVDGRFYLYVAAMWEPGLFILEVTDPRAPRLVRFLPGPPNTWTLQVQVADGRMITNLEHVPAGWTGGSDEPPQEGFVIWDVSDPEDPRRIGSWHGGKSGTHRNFYDGGRYVHAATTLPGYVGRLYGIVDIDDPAHPVLVGKWWYPGQHEAGGETFSAPDQRRRVTGKPQGNEALALHGGAYRDGDRVYCPWSRAGMVILDIADVTAPRHVSTLSAYPPLGSSCGMHTVVPLPDRGLAIVNDEALAEKCDEPLNFAGIVDISDENDPMMLSLFPVPEVPSDRPADFWLRGGRFGPHNQHQPQGQPCLRQSGDLVYLTYFNAGLQVYDIADPRRPRAVASFIPDEPRERRGPKPSDLVTQVEDVLVDRRGVIYISEKNSGITVLQMDS